jgi:hypothetical protein
MIQTPRLGVTLRLGVVVAILASAACATDPVESSNGETPHETDSTAKSLRLPSEAEFADYVWSKYPELRSRVDAARINPVKQSELEHNERVASALYYCRYRVGADRALCETEARNLQPSESMLLRIPLVWDYGPRIVDYDIHFSKHRVFYGFSPSMELRLEHVLLPHGGSMSLFAFDGERIIELVQRATNSVSAVLRGEGAQVLDMPTSTLARFLADSLSDQGFGHPEVIESRQHLLGVEDCSESFLRASFLRDCRPLFGADECVVHFGQSCEPGRYEVDRRELKRIGNRIKKPTLSGDRTHGWTMHYVTIERQALKRWAVVISNDMRVRVTEKLLSERVFTRFPMVVY